ncbi:MAG: hypothetical protein PHV20_01855 [Bacteroidales bacterium]|nr:hypothetical protein [Bacteroidales bacterium]
MKSEIYFQKNIFINQMWLFFMALITAISFSSCAQKVTFKTSSVVPAARGYVKIKKDKNENYNIEVKLFNLAEVNRLQPSKETYIVWMVTEQELVKNIGLVKSASSIFSKSLEGSFETVSSSKPSKIFITAEESSDVQVPGSKIVLATERF